MESLHRTIENETNALNALPVINQNVTRWAFIKEIDPKTLIDYALKYNLGVPEINKMTSRLEVNVKLSNNTTLLLASKELKSKTTYEI